MCDGSHVTAVLLLVGDLVGCQSNLCGILIRDCASLHFVMINDNLVCLYLMCLHMLKFKIWLSLQLVLLGFLSSGVAPTQNYLCCVVNI